MSQALKMSHWQLIMLFLAFFILFLAGGAIPVKAQVAACEDGTPGIGGASFPDINSDGCVDETDLSILLSCWNATPATRPDCLDTQTLVYNVSISPNPDFIFQGGTKVFDVTADGGTGVPAGYTSFNVTNCPASANCNLSPTQCYMYEAGECTVNLTISNTAAVPLGSYQVTVTGMHFDGSSDEGTLDLTITPPPNTFVTSGSHNGNFKEWVEMTEFIQDCGGITTGGNSASTVANCICTHYANQSSVMKPGEYHAWISYNQYGHPACGLPINAINNITVGAEEPNMPLIRRDGVIIANNRAALAQTATTPLLNPINMTQQGIQVLDGNVWTGSGSTGECVTGDSCQQNGYSQYPDWMEGSTISSAYYGNTSRTDAGWTYNSPPRGCNQAYRLYCVWYDSEVPTSWGGIAP